MSEDSRTTLTGVLWFFSAIALGLLFISAAAQGELTAGHFVLALIILTLAVAGTPYLLRWKDSETEQEKKKQRRIDTLLSGLNDEDIAELRQRLTESDERKAVSLDSLDDDGELVLRR